MPACKAIRDAELRAICTTCASRVLASKSNIGADLRAPCGVRMVWWGFRALKTPEERPHRRRFSVGSLILHFDCIHAANLLHFCCTNAATEVRSTAQMLQKYCTSTAFRNEDHENGTNRRDGSTEAAEQSGKAPGADALDRGEDRRGRTARRHSSMATRGRTRTDRAHLSQLLVSLQEDAAVGR